MVAASILGGMNAASFSSLQCPSMDIIRTNHQLVINRHASRHSTCGLTG